MSDFKVRIFGVSRRLLSAMAWVCSCVCLCLLMSGFVPFWGREMNVIATFNSAFEIFNLGKRSLMYCAASAAFSTIYIIAVVKIIISVISGLVGVKKWLFKRHDNKDTREATRKVVYNANSSIWWLFIVYVVSYLMYRFSLGVWSLIVIICLILFSVFMNAVKDILFKGKFAPCAIKAVNNGIILSCIIIFAFFSTNIQFSQIFEGLSMLFSNTYQGSKFFLQNFIQQVLAPIFNIIVIFSIIALNAKINNAEFEGKDSVKGFLICNLIFLGIMIIALGFVNRYTNFTDYLMLLYKNIVLVLVTALVYVTGVNDVELPKDTKYLTYSSQKEEVKKNSNIIPQNDEEEQKVDAE